MKNTEIITINSISAIPYSFKDERLAKATQSIVSIYNDAAKYADIKNREIAKILADVADKRSYEADGFKSVADYAHFSFGIARQNAYALATAGKVYNDKKAHPELQAMTPSKIAELSALAPADLTAALDAGKINHTTTQKDLREFANQVKSDPNSETSRSLPAEKAEVIRRFVVRACIPTLTEEQIDTYSSPKTTDDWDEYFTSYVSKVSPLTPVEMVKLPKGKVLMDGKNVTVNRTVYFNRNFSIVVELFPYTIPKSKKTSKKSITVPKYTKEELLSMLSELEGPHENDEEVAERLSK